MKQSDNEQEKRKAGSKRWLEALQKRFRAFAAWISTVLVGLASIVIAVDVVLDALRSGSFSWLLGA